VAGLSPELRARLSAELECQIEDGRTCSRHRDHWRLNIKHAYVAEGVWTVGFDVTYGSVAPGGSACRAEFGAQADKPVLRDWGCGASIN
jgi:hypothetical protein